MRHGDDEQDGRIVVATFHVVLAATVFADCPSTLDVRLGLWVSTYR